MRRPLVMLAALALPPALPAQTDSATGPDPIAQLVARLDLERYKATIKGLTNFGDRRQGTDRNRAAVDWIEAQLKSYGCGDVSRLKYEYHPPSPPSPEGRGGQGVRTDERAGQGVRPPAGGGRDRGIRAWTGVNTDSTQQPDARPRAQAPLHSLFASGIEEVSRSLRGRRPRGDTDTAVLTALARINAPC